MRPSECSSYSCVFVLLLIRFQTAPPSERSTPPLAGLPNAFSGFWGVGRQWLSSLALAVLVVLVSVCGVVGLEVESINLWRGAQQRGEERSRGSQGRRGEPGAVLPRPVHGAACPLTPRIPALEKFSGFPAPTWRGAQTPGIHQSPQGAKRHSLCHMSQVRGPDGSPLGAAWQTAAPAHFRPDQTHTLPQYTHNLGG